MMQTVNSSNAILECTACTEYLILSIGKRYLIKVYIHSFLLPKMLTEIFAFNKLFTSKHIMKLCNLYWKQSYALLRYCEKGLMYA